MGFVLSPLRLTEQQKTRFVSFVISKRSVICCCLHLKLRMATADIARKWPRWQDALVVRHNLRSMSTDDVFCLFIFMSVSSTVGLIVCIQQQSNSTEQYLSD